MSKEKIATSILYVMLLKGKANKKEYQKIFEYKN